MLRRSWAAPLLIPALAGTALAQTADPNTARQEVNVPAPAATPPPGQLDAQGNYTVKSGDTLWDLSQQFLNNPWYWPKIWADNPNVENPHWIYPGHELHIRRTTGGEPGEVSSADSEYAPPPAKQELADFSVGSVNGPGRFALGTDDVTVGGSIPIGLQPTQILTHIRVSSIITRHELDQAGTLTHSFAENTMLGQYDRVYAKFADLSNVHLGERFTVFRTDPKMVPDPISGKAFGYQTRLLGTVTVIGKTATEALCEIGPIIEDVERGDHLAPNTPLEATIKVTPNERNLTGIVLITDTAGLEMPGQNNIVFVNKGSADGVQDGNTFTVVQTGDGLSNLRLLGEAGHDDPTVRQDIATLVVFNVTEHASAALVVKSLREINLGDIVEMRKTPALTAGAGGDVR